MSAPTSAEPTLFADPVLPHSVQATCTGGGRRICIAWNVAYDKDWTGLR